MIANNPEISVWVLKEDYDETGPSIIYTHPNTFNPVQDLERDGNLS